MILWRESSSLVIWRPSTNPGYQQWLLYILWQESSSFISRYNINPMILAVNRESKDSLIICRTGTIPGYSQWQGNLKILWWVGSSLIIGYSDTIPGYPQWLGNLKILWWESSSLIIWHPSTNPGYQQWLYYTYSDRRAVAWSSDVPVQSQDIHSD